LIVPGEEMVPDPDNPNNDDNPPDCTENCVGDGLNTNKIYYHVGE
jgi:hypothetical protein